MPIDLAILLQIVQTVSMAVLALIGVGAKSYLRKRAKNLATKQDVGEITAQIESIRTQYAKQSLVHKLSFEKEFDILSELWETWVDLRNAAQSLRPMFDRVDLQETDEERKQKRLQRFSESYNAFVGDDSSKDCILTPLEKMYHSPVG